jgi:hypothetical protein
MKKDKFDTHFEKITESVLNYSEHDMRIIRMLCISCYFTGKMAGAMEERESEKII